MTLLWEIIYDVLDSILSKLKWFIAGYEMGAYKTQEVKAKAERERIEKERTLLEIEIRKTNSKRSSLDLARDTFEHGPSPGDMSKRGSGE